MNPVREQRFLVTGGAGVIGSELVTKLLEYNNEVVVYDNLSSGKTDHIEPFMKNKKFKFVNGDILDAEKLKASMTDCDAVFHLAANTDIKFKRGDPTDVDLKLNTVGTNTVLDSMTRKDIEKVVFSSSSAVYGDAPHTPLSEDYGPINPISLYGASKLSGEASVSAFCGMLGMRGWVFRFANIIGGKARAKGGGVITDFIRKLKQNPKRLEILGDGTQSKTYLLNEECVEGVLIGYEKGEKKYNVFNLGANEVISVTDIANIIVKELGLKDVEYAYTGGRQGWPGDAPYVLMNLDRLKSLGWVAKHSSREAVTVAVKATIKSLW